MRDSKKPTMAERKLKFEDSMAWCFGCNDWLDCFLFCKDKNRPFGVNSKCKKCKNIQKRIKNGCSSPSMADRDEAIKNGFIRCNVCKMYKEFFLFSTKRLTRYGRRYTCKECENKRETKKYRKNHKPSKPKRERKFKAGLAWCNKCNDWNSLDSFNEHKTSMFGIMSLCRRHQYKKTSLTPNRREREDKLDERLGWCSGHNGWADIDSFSPHKENWYQHYSMCKKCRQNKK